MLQILVLNLKSAVKRRKKCLQALFDMGVPEQAVTLLHCPRVADYPSVRRFCEHAGVTFPEFLTLPVDHGYRYLGVVYAHLQALKQVSESPDGTLTLVLEDDNLLNVLYADLCKQLESMQAHAREQNHPFMAQLRTWVIDGLDDDLFQYYPNGMSLPDTSLAFASERFPKTFYYGYGGLGCWANVYDSRSATLLKDSVLADLKQGFENFTALLPTTLANLELAYQMKDYPEYVFPFDIYIYGFASKLRYFTIVDDAGVFLQNQEANVDYDYTEDDSE